MKASKHSQEEYIRPDSAYLIEEANVTGAMKAAKEDMAGKTDLDAALMQVTAYTGHKFGQPGENFDYTYHSNDIIATLEGLRKQFIERKNKIDKEEFDLKAAFDSRKLGLENQKKFAEEEKNAKEMQEAEKSERKEAKEEEKTEETNAKAADQSFLDVLTGDCEAKAGLWDQRSKNRAAELTALGEALEALETGVKPNWGANQKLAGLQVPPASFLQLRGT